MARRRLRWSLLAVSLLVFDSGRHSGQLGVAITWPWNAEEQRLEKEKLRLLGCELLRPHQKRMVIQVLIAV